MFTIYDEEKATYVLVEEPDSSLVYTYADYLLWNYRERLELIRSRIFRMSGGAPLASFAAEGFMMAVSKIFTR